LKPRPTKKRNKKLPRRALIQSPKTACSQNPHQQAKLSAVDFGKTMRNSAEKTVKRQKSFSNYFIKNGAQFRIFLIIMFFKLFF